MRGCVLFAIFMTWTLTLAAAYGDLFASQGQTTIETQVGENPPAQAFMNALNATGGAYWHLWDVKRPPHTVEMFVGTPSVNELSYTWELGWCRYWEGEEIISTLRRSEQSCRLMLGGLTDRAWDTVRPNRVYQVRTKRFGTEVYKYRSGQTYCRISGSRGDGNWTMVDEPYTLPQCLMLFHGIVRW